MTEKFLDFSFEKTHSAYMLFYEREEKARNTEATSSVNEIDPELLSWIWKDNIQFIRDKQIFDLTYFNFMWILCSKVAPRFTESSQTSLSNVKLATSFLLETFIHSKERPGLKGWSDLLLDHFDNSREACQWFLDHMAEDSWWLYQILLKCPVQTTRQVSGSCGKLLRFKQVFGKHLVHYSRKNCTTCNKLSTSREQVCNNMNQA